MGDMAHIMGEGPLLAKANNQYDKVVLICWLLQGGDLLLKSRYEITYTILVIPVRRRVWPIPFLNKDGNEKASEQLRDSTGSAAISRAAQPRFSSIPFEGVQS